MSEYVRLPVEPTDKMVTAGVTALGMVGHPLRDYSYVEKIKNVWPKMVEVAVLEMGSQSDTTPAIREQEYEDALNDALIEIQKSGGDESMEAFRGRHPIVQLLVAKNIAGVIQGAIDGDQD